MYATEAPRYLRETMLRRGGTNEHGEPNYRLVRTEARKRLSTGLWTTWDENLSSSERREDRNTPWRTQVETRQVAMYPPDEHGWALERWFPATFYGTPETWFAPVEMGGTMKFIDGEYHAAHGGYPGRGDYEHTGFTFPEWALSDSIVTSAVGRIERAIQELTSNRYARMSQEMIAQSNEFDQSEREYDRWAKDVLDSTGNLWDARTPGGQAEVCRMAESIGIRSHPF